MSQPHKQPEHYYRISPAFWWLFGLIAGAFAFWFLFALTKWLHYYS